MASSSAEGGLALAVSGQGGREAAAVSGQGEGAAAAAVSGLDGRAAAAAFSGDGKAAVSRKRNQCDYDTVLDYPCTTRLRWRRLLAYLRDHCYYPIYHVAKNEVRVFLDVEDVVRRVRMGQLEEACGHLRTFAPIRHISSHAEVLTLFLHYLMAIHRFADGNAGKEIIVRHWFRNLYRHPALLSSSYPCLATLVADVLALRTAQVRNSLDWQLVRNKAAEMVAQMVSELPELKERTRDLHCQNGLYDVMPIRCSFRPRRQVKKVAGKKQATDLAKFYLEMKKRMVPSAHMDYHDYSGSSRNKFGLVMMRLFEKVLQAGQRKVLKQGHPPEYTSSGGFTLEAAHVWKSIPGHMMIGKGHQSENASNQVFPMHDYQSIAERMKIEQGHGPQHASNQAMKRQKFQESTRDTVYQENALKRI